jgi:hypothetical protein
MRSPQVNSILGPAPVFDFDGTLARLDIPWDGLRSDLGAHVLQTSGAAMRRTAGLT